MLISSEQKKIIRPSELARLLGVSRATLWRWSRDGILPPKRQIGPNVTGYFPEELEQWLASRPELKSRGIEGSQGAGDSWAKVRKST